VAAVTCTEQPSERFFPLERLVDGAYSSSVNSVQWPRGKTPVVTVTLDAETDVSAVVLREWHMAEGWDVGARRLEVSSDGFTNDVRTIETPFTQARTETWGSNVNTLYSVNVGQRASALRLTVEPAREDCTVYVAEIEVLGTRPGVAPDVRALTTGDLNGDGLDEVVACSDSGQIAALSAAGEKLWTWTGGEQSAIHCIVCADLNSDGRCEVAYGRSQATLGALSSAGEPMWSVALPQFRGIASDVMTLAAAQLDDDKGPELVAGCKSWQYFAFEGDGKQLWQNVIYAHSATVCRADDFDGDGKD